MKRCYWVNLNNENYINYHDKEWGKKVFDDKKLFELLILEMFQAGLTWECILNKRKDFALAYDNFDIDKVSSYNDDKIKELMNNKNIIRNSRKIKASINNSKVFKEIQKEYESFSNYIWHFTDKKVIYENDKTLSPLSILISNDLKKRGMSFTGPTIIYSYLCAIGVINSHDSDCFLFKGEEK